MIKKVFDKMDPEIQEAVKFLINEIVVKRELKKLEKSENKACYFARLCYTICSYER